MKKTSILLAIFIGMFQFVPNVVHADNRPIHVTEVHVSGGRPALFGLIGPMRYQTVETQYVITFSTNPETNEVTEVHRWVVDCSGEGYNKCKKTLPKSMTLIDGHSISSECISSVEAELIEGICIALQDKSSFQPNGSMSKTVLVTDEKGSRLTLLFHAVWRNGDSNGDADITISLFDITSDANLN